MTLEEIIAEMQRKPDAQTLIEWIDHRIIGRDANALDEIAQAVSAYFGAIES